VWKCRFSGRFLRKRVLGDRSYGGNVHALRLPLFGISSLETSVGPPQRRPVHSRQKSDQTPRSEIVGTDDASAEFSHSCRRRASWLLAACPSLQCWPGRFCNPLPSLLKASMYNQFIIQLNVLFLHSRAEIVWYFCRKGRWNSCHLFSKIAKLVTSTPGMLH
jgi:hypothetical protein